MEAKETGIAIKLSASEKRLYEAGKRAGIREVVEWLMENEALIINGIGNWDKWQAKLKEWGVDKPNEGQERVDSEQM